MILNYDSSNTLCNFLLSMTIRLDIAEAVVSDTRYLSMGPALKLFVATQLF